MGGFTVRLLVPNYRTDLHLWLRTGFEQAALTFGADEVLPIDEFPSTLKTLSSAYSYVYADGSGASRRTRQKSLLRYLTSPSASRSEYEGIIDGMFNSKRKSLAAELGKLRSIKSEAEQKIMRQAADISGRAHAKVSKFVDL